MTDENITELLHKKWKLHGNSESDLCCQPTAPFPLSKPHISRLTNDHRRSGPCSVVISHLRKTELLGTDEKVNLHEDAAQGFAVLGERTLLAVTDRLGDNLIVRPEAFLRGHHCFQLVIQHIFLPTSVYLTLFEYFIKRVFYYVPRIH